MVYIETICLTDAHNDYIINYNKAQADSLNFKGLNRRKSKGGKTMTTPQLYTTVALCIYTAVMIFIGCISYGKSKTLDGFLIGGRNIGAWATAFAYGTTYFSAVVFVG